jgi:dTDP-4-dehydrorhamnose reductase
MVDLLITGVYGQLGSALERIATGRGLAVIGHDLDTLDITDPQAVEATLDRVRPKTLVNCAAYTAVDACESDRATAFAINGEALGHLAGACNRVGARLLQISTDYVFAGDGNAPYTEAHPTDPASVYGQSKLLGERLASGASRHLIVRTAWLYGHGGTNFVSAIRRQLESGTEPLRVVADQVGSPTFADDLAKALLDLDSRDAVGVVHAANSGSTSWHGFACEIARRLGRDTEIVSVTTAEFPRPAPRPAYSVLDTSRLMALIGRPLPEWQDAVGRCLEAACGS